VVPGNWTIPLSSATVTSLLDTITDAGTVLPANRWAAQYEVPTDSSSPGCRIRGTCTRINRTLCCRNTVPQSLSGSTVFEYRVEYRSLSSAWVCFFTVKHTARFTNTTFLSYSYSYHNHFTIVPLAETAFSNNTRIGGFCKISKFLWRCWHRAAHSRTRKWITRPSKSEMSEGTKARVLHTRRG
jgi:hypothetical protein